MRLKEVARHLLPAPLYNGAEKVARKISWQLRYRGNTYYCPCCAQRSGSFKKFRSKSIDLERLKPQNSAVRCPICHSLPRHRIIAHYLSKNTLPQLTAGPFIFFAPEQALINYFKKADIHYQSADLFRKDVDLHISITDMPFEGGTISAIMCNHVLEHVDDYKKALREIARVLQPGGLFLFTVPMKSDLEKTIEDPTVTDPKERIKRFGRFDHLRLFGLDLLAVLRASGFSVDIIKGDELPAEIMPVTGPVDYDINWLFVCTKNS